MLLLFMIGRRACIRVADSYQRRLLRIDFECLGLLLLINVVVSCLSVITAMWQRIGFCDVLVILAALLMSAEIWRWLGNQVLLH